MSQFLHFVLALTILTQAPSLDSSSPKERREAIEAMTGDCAVRADRDARGGAPEAAHQDRA